MTIPILRALLEKATVPPWTSNSEGGRDICDCSSGFYLESLATPFSRSLTEDDNAFVVAAVNALPQLLAIAEAAQRLDDGLLDMGECYRAPAILCEELHATIAALSPTQPEAR